LSISRLSLYGNSNVGAFSFATDRYALLPPDVPEKVAEEVASTLNVPVVRATISGSVLLGVFIVGNSRGVLLPSSATDEEIGLIEKGTGASAAVYEGKRNALGNMVLVNDSAAMVGSDADTTLRRLISDHLKVEVFEGTIASLRMPGACAVATSRGVVCHPLTSESELSRLGEVFNIPVDVSTINRGFPYPRIGMTANSHGVVVGEATTGPEMARIESSLGLIR